MGVVIDVLKFLVPLGIVGSTLRFLIDRLWSIGIEFDIETNYSRAFREVFNLCITFTYVTLIILMIALWLNPDQGQGYEVVSSVHFTIDEKEYSEYLTLKKRNEQALLIILIVTLAILVGAIHTMCRSFWYSNYRRRAYVKFQNKKFYVVKRISKERILFSNDKSSYRIVELSELNNKVFKQESIKERRNRRYKNYFEAYEKMRQPGFWRKFDIFMMIVLCLLLLIAIGIGIAIQEYKIIFVISIVSVIVFPILYNRSQYKKGKKLHEENSRESSQNRNRNETRNRRRNRSCAPH